ncbi:MAG: STAS domain-containing protein [Pyrinomonadaceae bacterium]
MINLYIKERTVGDITVLDLKGRERIAGNAVALYKSICCLLQEGKTRIILNVSGVTYIDPIGLGELISSQVSALNKGGEIKLINLTAPLGELLAAAKLLAVMDVYENELEALASFAGQGQSVGQPQLSLV